MVALLATLLIVSAVMWLLGWVFQNLADGRHVLWSLSLRLLVVFRCSLISESVDLHVRQKAHFWVRVLKAFVQVCYKEGMKEVKEENVGIEGIEGIIEGRS